MKIKFKDEDIGFAISCLMSLPIPFLSIYLSSLPPDFKCEYDIYQGGRLIDKGIYETKKCESHMSHGLYYKVIKKEKINEKSETK